MLGLEVGSGFRVWRADPAGEIIRGEGGWGKYCYYTISIPRIVPLISCYLLNTIYFHPIITPTEDAKQKKELGHKPNQVRQNVKNKTTKQILP